MDYGETFLYGEEKLTFHYANHIPGSAQVLIETEKGRRLLYTGDIKLPGAPIISADLLVIEATYGKPNQCRYFQNRINRIFAEFVMQKIKDNSIIIRGYHGKLQEALKILRSRNVLNPVFMPPGIFEATKVCE